jgi:hypothetical protein
MLKRIRPLLHLLSLREYIYDTFVVALFVVGEGVISSMKIWEEGELNHL